VKKPWIMDGRICWLVLLTFSLLAIWPTHGHAALSPSRLASGEMVAAERAEQIAKIRQALEQQVVAQRLADYGLTPAEVEAKLPTLSDEQLQQLAGLSDTLAEGGVLGVIIALLVITLLVIVILKLMNRQIIIR